MALVLASLWLWGQYESHVEASLDKAYKPLPLPENPQYSTQDVSIVVATIDTPGTLPQSLCEWLRNDPHEIIIVTIQRDLQLVQSLVSQVPHAATITRVVTCGITNKREQLAKGIRMARGQIIALVDDDAFWPATTVLPFLLAGLEADPSVGGVQGRQSAYIPESRRKSDEITPWEVAAIRCLEVQNRVQASRFAADGGCFCLVGRTMLLRSSLLNEEFLHAMCNDYWAGNKLSTGDDCFISRWMMNKGWKFCIQNADEAEILTLIPSDSKMLLQNVRWKRSSFQSCLKILFYCPGLSRFRR
ncbi:hypothetical protein KVR01_013847 [Diaporthe batatas]|uniref:uncharacterized protein n=1 Tax=Diaporthe batatas TaxID=748121 RepID=UPI001D03A3D6|nr:uncharacterized protein KVR01_013847 [Diaporthe batatas]KAG8156312.1 hypothetical protein KVR01_013847 [Diaporthe batatas]